MRKLASVQVVTDILPIEGADRIELAKVLGWQCVTLKNEFKKGDLAVYFEVDSFLPVCDKFEFLRKTSYKKSNLMGEGFRLRTMKMRGEISQGLLQPISVLPEGDWKVGDDVTEILGVKKWEIEEVTDHSGTIIAELPEYITKTDEMRVQSMPGLIEEFKKAGRYYITTKMDGSSSTLWIEGGKVRCGGHNYEFADDGKSGFWEYIKKKGIEEKVREFGIDNLTIQGELCGGGIQKNRLRLREPEWYVFTIVDRTTNRRLSLGNMMAVCEKLGLTMVPVEEIGDKFTYDTVEKLLERAKGKYECGNRKEGIVIRPVIPCYSKILSAPLSMKVLNNEYLLKDVG